LGKYLFIDLFYKKNRGRSGLHFRASFRAVKFVSSYHHFEENSTRILNKNKILLLKTSFLYQYGCQSQKIGKEIGIFDFGGIKLSENCVKLTRFEYC